MSFNVCSANASRHLVEHPRRDQAIVEVDVDYHFPCRNPCPVCDINWTKHVSVVSHPVPLLGRCARLDALLDFDSFRYGEDLVTSDVVHVNPPSIQTSKWSVLS